MTGAACDSRFAREGNVFFCKGRAFRTSYLASALEAGAVAYACEQDRADELAQAAPGAPAIVVSDMRRAMALVSARAFGRPDLDVPQVGITGTKGKSTTAYMLRSIIDAAGGTRSCGIIGSIDTYDGIEDAESTNTTPEAPDLWRHLANARDAQLSAMVMEVSSQALKYDRTLGVQLDVAAFLNIGSDHISPVEHPTFEDYFASKLRIFSQCHRAVVNLGTSNLERVLDAGPSRRRSDGHDAPELVCVSATGPEAVECGSCDMVFPDIWATDVEPRGASLAFVAHGTTADGHPTSDPAEKAWELPVVIGFPGLFNVENALVAIACARTSRHRPRLHRAGSCQLSRTGAHGAHRQAGIPGAMASWTMPTTPSPTRSSLPPWPRSSPVGASWRSSARRAARPTSGASSCPARRHAGPATSSWPRRTGARLQRGHLPRDGRQRTRRRHTCGRHAVTHEYVLDRQQAVARCLDVALSYGQPALVCLLGKGDETLIHRGDEFQPMVPDGEAFRRAAAERGVEL